MLSMLTRYAASTLLIAYTDRREALVYSLPYLEHMHSLQISQSSNEYVDSLFELLLALIILLGH